MLTIAEVIGRYVELRRSGVTLRGLCPFHPDTNPSLVVYPLTGRFLCFGCSALGDVISFVMRYERVGFTEALTLLERRLPQYGRDTTPEQRDAA